MFTSPTSMFLVQDIPTTTLAPVILLTHAAHLLHWESLLTSLWHSQRTQGSRGDPLGCSEGLRLSSSGTSGMGQPSEGLAGWLGILGQLLAAGPKAGCPSTVQRLPETHLFKIHTIKRCEFTHICICACKHRWALCKVWEWLLPRASSPPDPLHPPHSLLSHGSLTEPPLLHLPPPALQAGLGPAPGQHLSLPASGHTGDAACPAAGLATGICHLPRQ